MPATESKIPQPYGIAGMSVHDLLASCAAAEAVSRPPRAPESCAPEPQTPRTAEKHREAA